MKLLYIIYSMHSPPTNSTTQNAIFSVHTLGIVSKVKNICGAINSKTVNEAA